MTSETVDAIDWPLPLTVMGNTPSAPRAQYKPVQPWPGIDPATFSLQGNYAPACAANQSILQCRYTCGADNTYMLMYIYTCVYIHALPDEFQQHIF